MQALSSVKYKTLYSLWAALFVLTAVLGFVPDAEGVIQFLLRLLAAVFFLPPWLIVLKARLEGDFVHTRRIRRLAAAWLLAATILLCAGIASVSWPEAVGNGIHGVMTLVCAPLVCGNFYALPLFLWATLLIGSKSKHLGKTR